LLFLAYSAIRKFKKREFWTFASAENEKNDMAAPKVSVLMSVYNGERYLCEAIDSILNQTFKDFEFLIINDGSTDRTADIMQSYEDLRIIIINNEKNIGLTKSLNKGLRIAKGKYIARQDADDISLPLRFEKQVDYMDKHTDVVVVSCNIEVIDDGGQTLGRSDRAADPGLIAWYLPFYNYIGGHGRTVFRHQPVMKLGGYSEDLRYSQDYELWLCLAKSHKIAILPDVLVKWRRHDNNISVKDIDEQQSYSLANSRKRLAALTNEQLSVSQVSELRGFWEGRFPSGHQVSLLHTQLKRIYLAFLQERMLSGALKFELSRNLRIIIGKQFVKWVRTLSKRHQLTLKLKVSFYAFKWHPVGILKCWLSELLQMNVTITSKARP